jgi:hypothetical protein
VFERYTEKARRVVFFARYEASEFGSPYIESEHLLLGFFRESKALSARVLSGSLFSIDDIRKEIEKRTTPREKIPTSVDLPLSNECKHILHYASEEADRLGHRHIGTEHLLLGLLLERDCFAAHLLNERGISLEGVRANTRIEEPTTELSKAKSPGIPAGYRWETLLYNPASETIIVEMRSDTGHPPRSRLFIRNRSADAYEQVGNPAGNVSYEAAVTCQKQPIIIFNSMKWEGRGGNDDGVYVFNLLKKELSVCVAKNSLDIPQPHLRSWVLTLVSLSDDGQTLYLKIGIETPVSSGAVVQYYLASLGIADKKLELLSHLKDIRF